MRLEVVNGQFGFIGKVEERRNIERAIQHLLVEINSLGCLDDDECNGKLEISYMYDTDEYKVSDIKKIWKNVKKKF